MISTENSQEMKWLIGQPAELVRQTVEPRGWQFRVYDDGTDGMQINDCAIMRDRITVKTKDGVITSAWIG